MTNNAKNSGDGIVFEKLARNIGKLLPELPDS